ncbi:DUF2490 domain-containing protein [Aquimarina brevivitae]|uniref:Uncharacterized protein DUF2490 n=1 Tax=Aquimarina brevivitae TaxID=323412 RepID=A0A4Q7PI05_9FLAO|nr:DUF2490 domain-containing protein [Aquimarina brevivitae]RZT00232.1 uncharacterized protein DUF2490 [Aquimarina brevivitae]
MKKIIFTLVILISAKSYTQNEFFLDVYIEKELFSLDRLSLLVETNYKHAYQKSRWRRGALNVKLEHQLSSNWLLFGKLVNNYRFDNILGDFYELRPSLGVGLKVPLFKKISFAQKLAVEWRNFFISRHDQYLRSRYKVQLNYRFDKRNEWNINSGFEWFFLRDPVLNERYSTSRRFSTFISKEIKTVTLKLGYQREVFLRSSSNFNRIGNTVSFQIAF